MSVWTEQDQYLVQLPLDQYIHTVIKDKVIHVQGLEWESLFKNVLAAGTGATVDEVWTKHINKASYSNDFYFRPSVAVTETLAPIAEAQIVTQDKDIEWEQSLAASIKNGIGRSVQPTKDDGYLVAWFGYTDYPVLFVLKAGPDGKILWMKTVGKKDDIRDKTDATLYPTPDGGYLMAGYDKWQGNPDGTIHLLKWKGQSLMWPGRIVTRLRNSQVLRSLQIRMVALPLICVQATPYIH